MEKKPYPAGTKAKDKKYVDYVQNVEGTPLTKKQAKEKNGWTEKEGKLYDKSGKEVQWGEMKYMSQTQ